MTRAYADGSRWDSDVPTTDCDAGSGDSQDPEDNDSGDIEPSEKEVSDILDDTEMWDGRVRLVADATGEGGYSGLSLDEDGDGDWG